MIFSQHDIQIRAQKLLLLSNWFRVSGFLSDSHSLQKLVFIGNYCHWQHLQLWALLDFSSLKDFKERNKHPQKMELKMVDESIVYYSNNVKISITSYIYTKINQYHYLCASPMLEINFSILSSFFRMFDLTKEILSKLSFTAAVSSWISNYFLMAVEPF